MKKILLFIIVLALTINLIPSSSYAEGMYMDEYIKVKLQRPIKSNSSIKLSSDEGFSIYSFNDILSEVERFELNEIIVTLGDENKIFVKDMNDNILFSFGNNDNIYISSTDVNEPIIKVEDDKYRDYLTFIRKSNSITVVNCVTLVHYLYGVVPREMPSSFPLDALKAQAIACRNFSLKNMNKHISDGYNLCDSTDCQVYGGYDGETEITNKAVDETENMILVYNGELVNTLYHSNSGGYTEDSQNVWGNFTPYLKAVDDEFSKEAPNSNWELVLSSNEIKNRLLKNNIDVGDVVSLQPIEVSENGRVIKLKIEGTKKDHILEKDKIRQVFGYSDVKSNWFEVKATGNTNLNKEVYVVDGKTKGPVKVNSDNIFVVNGSKVKTITSRSSIRRITTNKGIEDVKKEFSSVNGQFVLVGKGYGHGVGMSQWGARKMAELGYTYEDILKHYYNGVELIIQNK